MKIVKQIPLLVGISGFCLAYPACSAPAPKMCGDEPRPPTLSMSSPRAFNVSVDRFDTFNKAARTYYQCIVTQGQKEEKAVSEAARLRIKAIHDETMNVQKRIAARLKSLSAELASGRQKFSKK